MHFQRAVCLDFLYIYSSLIIYANFIVVQMTSRTKVEFIDKIIEDRTKCGNDLKKWDPFMRVCITIMEVFTCSY